jgi:xanthine dehydrogenase molybdenum-binding subunit
MATLSFTLNGKPLSTVYEDGMHFLQVLREECGVTSVKDGCAPQGYCGCCAVLVDGKPVLACLKKPEQIEGKEVTTLEGIPDEQRRVLSRAFVQEGGIQCGYCIPGIVTRAAALMERGQAADRDAVVKALPGHLCRCTGYSRIVDSIQTAGDAWNNGGEFPTEQPRRVDYFGEQYGLVRATQASPSCHGVGSDAARYRGLEHAMGEKPYVADMHRPDMLHGAVVLSEHARARVITIDPAPALELPGVTRVLTAQDVPGQKSVGLIRQDWPVFVAEGDSTRCVGDVLALVVADTQHHARQAADAVRIEYEVLEPVTDPSAALEPDAPQVHESGNLLEVSAFSRGKVDAALAESAHVIEQRFVTQRIEHAFLEPEACLAVPEGGGDRLTVYSQGQGVHDDQLQIAAILGIDKELIDVELVTRSGPCSPGSSRSGSTPSATRSHSITPSAPTWTGGSPRFVRASSAIPVPTHRWG